jgi:hypothetical protein
LLTVGVRIKMSNEQYASVIMKRSILYDYISCYTKSTHNLYHRNDRDRASGKVTQIYHVLRTGETTKRQIYDEELWNT